MKKGIIQVFTSNVIFMIFGALTNFILPKYLSIETYANFRTYVLFISYAGILTFGYIDGMYLRYGGKTFEEAKEVGFYANVGTFFLFQMIIFIIIEGIGFIFRNALICLLSIGILVTNFCNYIKNFTTATGDFHSYSIMTSLEKIMVFFLNVVMVFLFQSDNTVIYILILIIVPIIEILYYILLKKNKFNAMKIYFDYGELKLCIALGIILMAGNLMSNVFTGIDQWFIKLFMKNRDFAIYSFSVSMERMIALFVTPVSTVMYSFMCKDMKSKIIKKVQEGVLIWASALMIFFFPIKWIIKRYITEYIGAIDITCILLAGQIISCVINCIYVNIYKAQKKQKAFLKQMIVMSLVSIITDIVFYNIFRNILSIAVATVITKVIWLVICELNLKDFRYTFPQNVVLIMMIFVGVVLGLYANELCGLIIYAFLLFFIFLYLLIKRGLTKKLNR